MMREPSISEPQLRRLFGDQRGYEGAIQEERASIRVPKISFEAL